MRNTILIFAVFLLAACSHKVDKADISKLEGYWEIKKVTMADGSEKDYKINETVDHFEMKGDSGIRKKVTPLYDGRYLVNDASEKVKVVFKGDKAFLDYTTSFTKYEDEILTLTNEELVVKNSEKIQYVYKRPVPFSVK